MSETDRLGQLENPQEIAEMAEYILIALGSLEKDHPHFLASSEAQDPHQHYSPYFYDNPRATYDSFKYWLSRERDNPSSDETNLRKIYAELKEYLDVAADELANVHSIQARNSRLVPAEYIRENFDLLAVMFRKRQSEAGDSESFKRMAEEAVLGKFPRALDSVPREYQLGLRRQILIILDFGDTRKTYINSFDLIALLDLLQIGNKDLELIMGEDMNSVAGVILSARRKIIDARDACISEGEVTKRSHLRIVEPLTPC